MERTEHFRFRTESAADTGALGQVLGRHIPAGASVALVGPLGAGKTVLVRGICRGLGVDDYVVSPTFILYEEFSGRAPVIHVDLYRLEHEMEIEELGVFDRLGGSTVTLVEWGDRSPILLAAVDAVVTIEPGHDDDRILAVDTTTECAATFEELGQWLFLP